MDANIYVKQFVFLLSIFVSYHLIVWTFFTAQIFEPKTGTGVGDLGRMSYQIDLLHNRQTKYTLTKKHLHSRNFKNQHIDIITIGDSFSNGGGGGDNPFYQDHLATNLDKNVLNIAPSHSKTSLQTIVGLYNSGYLAKLKPEAIIVESVQRIIPHRYNKEIDFSIKIDKPTISVKPTETYMQPINIINTANYKIPYYYVKYRYKTNAQKNVHRFRLNKKLFSVKNGKNILLLNDDIKNLNQFTQAGVEKVNANFNRVATLLKTIDIKLYFLPAIDKYDLYYNYIIQDKYPKNLFFELIRPLHKEYYFIDTKEILSALLDAGVEDIYFIDDTHWSQKASSAISKSQVFKD